MSLECSDCERDLRAGHSLDCPRYKRQIPLPRYFTSYPDKLIQPNLPRYFYIERDFVSNGKHYSGVMNLIRMPKPL